MYLGLCGRKGSGKSTLAKRIAQQNTSASTRAIAKDRWLRVCRCSFAAPLKQMCGDLFGLTDAQMWGDERNSLTQVKWENLPHFEEIDDSLRYAAEKRAGLDTRHLHKGYWDDPKQKRFEEYLRLCDVYRAEAGKQGLMTARELLQEVGTGIFRRMDPDCWVRAAMADCEERFLDLGYQETPLFVFDDLRFANEAAAIEKKGGVVVRLLGGTPDDHESESLDGITPDLEVDSFAQGVDKTAEQVLQFALGMMLPVGSN